MMSIGGSVGKGTSNTPVAADEKTVFFLAERAIRGLYGDRGRASLVPRVFRSGKLFISCSGPLWANELWVGKAALLERINSELGHDGVRDIGIAD